MTEPIQSEWDRHKSRFTRKWFRSMLARKKIERSMGVRVHLAEITGLSTTEEESLEKDLCLIEAACDGDGIVVTRDDELVTIWQKCHDQFHLVKPIMWINPVTDDIGIFERL